MIPQTLFGMNAFIGGVTFKGEVPEFTLPKLTVKTEKLRAGGMDGEVGMDMGVELGEASFTTNGVRKEALKYVGLVDGTAFKASFRGSFMGLKGVATGVIATIRGRLKEVDPGSWKAGEKAEFKFACEPTYYKLEVGGSVMYEIDPLNAIRVIDGVDQLAEVRSQLGL